MTEAGNPITMADMVQTEVTHAITTGVMQDAYCDWKCILQAGRNWSYWKEHFIDAFHELNKLNAITADELGYEAHNIAQLTFMDNVTMACNNLALAATSKTNKALENVTKENEKLLNMVDQLTK